MLAGSAITLSAIASGTGTSWPARTAGQSAGRTYLACPARAAWPSHSADRPYLAGPARAAQPSHSVSPGGVTQSVSGSPSTVPMAATAPRGYRTPRQIARSLLDGFHWRRWQFRYLDLLWARESGWDRHASDQYSGAYGIPQALPGSKMASAGPDWQWNPRTQILWGLRYIKGRYRTPYRAWLQECLYGWY